MLVLKCLILALFENSKEGREHNTYKMSSDVNECIPIHSFELNSTALSTDKFQLTDDQVL
jgi:hypothetical protein